MRVLFIGFCFGLILLACESSPQSADAEAELDVQERRERAEGFCERAQECESLALLFSTDECSLQTHQKLERLFNKTEGYTAKANSTETPFDARRCQHCITALTCEGMTQVARAEISLEELCPRCTEHLKYLPPKGACLLSGIALKEIKAQGEETPAISDASTTDANQKPQGSP